MLLLCAVAAQSASPTLSFRLDEGQNINSFVREGSVAAHLLLRSGREPRILVAFPAGNSGVGLWFTNSTRSVTWTLTESPRPITQRDAKGRPLHGIEVLATIDANALEIDEAVLSSVRALRDYELLATAPAEVLTSPMLEDQRLVWARDRLDGAPGYRLSIEALHGASMSTTSIKSNASGHIRLRIQALTGEPPLTPLTEEYLLTPDAAQDRRARNALTFLSYEEKLLAGSWRFDTYFGRDTLISLMLLAPVLQPAAMESGLGSVLVRLAPNGEVAHEEDIGEFAVLRNIKEGRGRRDTPIYDYGMIDDDFMLAPVAAHWLLENAAGRARAKAFLADSHAANDQNGATLVRNLRWVVERTAAFADDPRLANLVAIKEGRSTGQWRDSEEGLGRGRYPYDVNAVLVPAALRATDRLLKSGLLDPYLTADVRRVLTRADAQYRVWSIRIPSMFVTGVPADRARASVRSYAAEVGVDDAKALASLDKQPLSFNALSLDSTGRPIPVMHSDGGFALLFGTPTPDELHRSIETAVRPFPAGLLTSVGMLVSNPAFADDDTRARFTSADYHGTVVWSWQHAVLAAGLERQLARTDLSAALRARLLAGRSQLWSVIEGARALQTSELWSWSFQNGRYHIEPFGGRGADADESNAAQLWSTVFLALQPPALRDPMSNQ